MKINLSIINFNKLCLGLGKMLILCVGLITLLWGVQKLSAEPEIALIYGEPWEDMRQRSSAKISPAIPNEL